MRDLEGREHLEAVRALQAAEEAYVSNDPGAARPHLDRCLFLDPELSRAWELMGMIELLQGNLATSIEHMGRATSGDKALTEAGTVLSLISSPGWPRGDNAVEKVASLAAMGQAFLNKGMYPASAVCIRGVEGLAELGWQFLSLLGFIYRQMDLLDTSLEYYEKAMKSGGPRDELSFDRALVLVKLGRLDEAAEAFRSYSEGSKGSPQSWNDLGVVLEATGKLEEAMGAYERAIAMDQDYYIAFYSKGKLMQKMGQMDEARPFIQRALDLESRVFDIEDIRSSKEAPKEGGIRAKEIMKRRPDS
jgi:tetratricopeptide (TPR) repeat protein